MSTMNNTVRLIGNLGQDPAITNLDSGKKIAKFTMATADNYKNQNGERVTDTQWHTVIAWNKTAEIIEKFVKKGHKLAVDGKLTHRSYEDKEGITRYVTEIVCNEVLLMQPAS